MPDQLEFQDPSGQGVLYMGPELSPEDEAALRRKPGGTRVMPTPPPAPEPQAAAPVQAPGWTSPEYAQHQATLGPNPTLTQTSSGSYAPVRTEDEEMWGMMQRMGVPMDKAVNAIAAWTRLGAQRLYTQNVAKYIAAGMSPGAAQAKAIAEGGPSLFANGGAAALARPQPAAQPPIRQLYEQDTFTAPDGKMWYRDKSGIHPVVNPRQAAPPTETLQAKFAASKGTEGVPPVPAKPPMRVLGVPIPFTGQDAQPGIAARPATPAYTVTRRGPVGTVRPPEGMTSTESSKPQGALVRRKTKDGRTALFDANTREFIRYADDAS